MWARLEMLPLTVYLSRILRHPPECVEGSFSEVRKRNQEGFALALACFEVGTSLKGDRLPSYSRPVPDVRERRRCGYLIYKTTCTRSAVYKGA